jgi:tetratricopeptide (TPR) repeat protein
MDDPDTLDNEEYQPDLQEKYEKSRRKNNSALRHKEDPPESLYNKGLEYQQQEGHNKAIQYFSSAIEISKDLIQKIDLDPNCAYYYKLIGNCYYSLRNYEEAIKYYEEALKYYEKGLIIKSEYAEIHYDKGVVFAAQGKYKASIECYETALRYNRNCYLAHNNRSYMLYILERYQEALEACNQCLTIHDNYKYALVTKALFFCDLDITGKL